MAPSVLVSWWPVLFAMDVDEVDLGIACLGEPALTQRAAEGLLARMA